MKPFNNLILLSLCILFFGCGDDTCKCERLSDVSEEFRTYLPLSVGNFFVYQLKGDTTVKDTLTCTKTVVNDVPCPEDNTRSGFISGCSKTYHARLEHSNVEYFPSKGGAFTYTSGVELVEFAVFGREYLRFDRIMQWATAADKFSLLYTNYDFGVAPDSTYGVYIIGSDNLGLKINDQDYKDCILSIKPPTVVDDLRILDSMYFCKKIGIVQYKDDDDTWQLTDYFVN